MPDTTPQPASYSYEGISSESVDAMINDIASGDTGNTVPPKKQSPFNYSVPNKSGGHSVRITIKANAGGGGGGAGGSDAGGAKGASSESSSGNSNAGTSEGGGGGGLAGTIGAIGDGIASFGGGGNLGSGATLGTIGFPLTNTVENRVSAQWDATEFGLLGAALEEFRNGASAADILRDSAGSVSTATELAIRKLTAFATSGKQTILGGTGGDIISAATRRVENPYREQLFKTMNFRTFPLSFKLSPANAGELSTYMSAISQLERNMHPQKQAVFLIYPAEFELEFLYNGATNRYMPKLQTCVLTDMNISYGHGGFMTAFKGTGGAPTEINLTLNFKELILRDRSHVDPYG